MSENPTGEPEVPAQPTAPAPEAAAGPGPTDEQGAAPAAEHVPAPAVDRRPKPEFGEYAPEGWEWKPEDDATESSAHAAASAPERAGGGSAPLSGPAARASATLQGVPHNLGTGSTPGARRAPEQAGSGAPYRAAAPGQPTPPQQAPRQQQPPRFQAPQQGGAGYPQKPQRTGDRVVTIVLLVFGAFGALQSALAMMGMGATFAILSGAPGLGDLTLPGWVDLTGKIAGMALLVLYGLVLVYSIRRMRAGKLTFWAPLAAGVVAAITVVTIIASALLGTPEIMEVMQDPARANELLDYLQEMQGM